MTAHVHLTSSDWKEKNGGIRQRGTCWQPIEPLVEATSMSEISEELRQQNGFYALVWEKNDQLIAAVDHIRSIPLFYALKDGEFYLSDDAEWVREQVDNKVMDLFAKEEFQLTGYVTGQDTLYPDVKQLQAGEFLSINTKIDSQQLKTERYYRFLHKEPEGFNEQELYQQLDAAALASIDNLIRYANGRQIVIPLSGGYDSRLVAILLKRRGYENILTFTYGAAGNKESAYSKMVADALGLKWHFVEYRNELWRDAWDTDERLIYQKWGSGWNSIAHVQDWLAVKILREDNIVNKDCVFAPGHTGDFISGGHIPSIAIKDESSTLKDLWSAIYEKHYSLAPKYLVTKNNEDFWYNRVSNRAEFEEIIDGVDLANGFEKWEWQERQAKFICNSVRVYEFFGYDWWLPLWDKEFVIFWQYVPLELRKGRNWYIDYVKKSYKESTLCNNAVVGGIGNAADRNKRIIFGFIVGFFKRIIPEFIVIRVKRELSIRRVQDHPLCVSGRIDFSFWKKYFRKGYSQNGITIRKFLDECSDGNYER